MAYSTNNGVLTTSGLAEAGDWNAVVNKYSSEIGLQYSTRTTDDIIRAEDVNNLITAIQDTANGKFIIEQLPNKVYKDDIIVPMSWGGAIAIDYPEVELTSPGDYTYIVPAGITKIHILNMIAGGGSGGIGWNQEKGQTGGGGGSGGYISDTYVDVSPNDTILFRIGSGGKNTKVINSDGTTSGNIRYVSKPTDGTNSELYINGNINNNVTCTGGGRGGSPPFLADGYTNSKEANDPQLKNKVIWNSTFYDPNGNKVTVYSGNIYDNCDAVNNNKQNVLGLGGKGGSPNGNTGSNGAYDGGRTRGGVRGADSPLGVGGSYVWINKNGTNTTSGNNAKGYGQDGSGYGSGGGSSGIYDANSEDVCWWGGDGAGGYCKFKFTAK